MSVNRQVLLSFDIEEFDVPAEYGIDIPFDRQISISVTGTLRILDLLKGSGIKATFFSTVVFAKSAQHVIDRIIAEGHELASHGWFHSSFENKDLITSKNELARISGVEVKGFRMARMMNVDDTAIKDAGYFYNSSLNPIYLPGRYNNFGSKRTVFKEHGLVHLPASATPLLRIPLFWLSFHHLPFWLYKMACQRTINNDDYLNIYFHPWEFADISDPQLGLPWLIRKNSGEEMVTRFRELLLWMQRKHYTFGRLIDFAERQ
ncbi:MAG TPA: polysaccharide deacetylase family protein [Cyclobacteriaceae bacterium]|nr:polysaccharide deacetylase family protein [Cyclobacteriaceae bacterium]